MRYSRIIQYKATIQLISKQSYMITLTWRIVINDMLAAGSQLEVL